MHVPCGEPVLPCVPLVGVLRKGILGSVETPLSLLDAVSFRRGMCPSYHSRRLYVPNPPQCFRRLPFPEEVRWSPRCTYPLILALEGNIRDDCSITFPWSSARPWVTRVWLAPWAGPLWVRFAGEEGQVEGQIRVGRRLFLCCRRVAGLREAWPPPGGCLSPRKLHPVLRAERAEKDRFATGQKNYFL